MQNERLRDAIFGPDGLSDQFRREIRAFALMDLPTHDLSTEDVHDQIEVEEHSSDRRRHPGYVPCPYLTGRTGLVAGGWFTAHRRLGPATVMLLPIGAQDAVKTGFRGQIFALISQFWNDLTGWQTGKFRRIAYVQNGGALLLTELVARRRARDKRSLIGSNLATCRPAAQGAFADLQLSAGFGTASASSSSLFDQGNGDLGC